MRASPSGSPPATSRVDVQPRSERDVLGTAFVTMVANLRRLVGDVTDSAGTSTRRRARWRSTSDETGRAVGEIAAAVGDVAQGAERQVRMVESTREAVQEAARAADASAQTAQATADAADSARRAARDGADAAERATDAIQHVAAVQRAGQRRDPGPVGALRAHRRDRGHDHRHRRADQPARAQRRDRPRRRARERRRRRADGPLPSSRRRARDARHQPVGDIVPVPQPTSSTRDRRQRGDIVDSASGEIPARRTRSGHRARRSAEGLGPRAVAGRTQARPRMMSAARAQSATRRDEREPQVARARRRRTSRARR